MKKIRGQWSIVGMIMFIVALIIGLALIPTIGTQTMNSLSNSTLFPTNGPAYLIGGLIPFIFIVMLIISGFMMMTGGNQNQQ